MSDERIFTESPPAAHRGPAYDPLTDTLKVSIAGGLTLEAGDIKIEAGDASAENQLAEIARLEEIRDKLASDPATAAGVAAVLDQLKQAMKIVADNLPLPNGAATELTAAEIVESLASVLAQLKTTLKVSTDALPLPQGAATADGVTALTNAAKALSTGSDAVTITPNDTTDLATPIRSIYVGGAGDVTVKNAAGSNVVFKNAVAGSTINLAAKRVMAAGTTATNLVGLV